MTVDGREGSGDECSLSRAITALSLLGSHLHRPGSAVANAFVRRDARTAPLIVR